MIKNNIILHARGVVLTRCWTKLRNSSYTWQKHLCLWTTFTSSIQQYNQICFLGMIVYFTRDTGIHSHTLYWHTVVAFGTVIEYRVASPLQTIFTVLHPPYYIYCVVVTELHPPCIPHAIKPHPHILFSVNIINAIWTLFILHIECTVLPNLELHAHSEYQYATSASEHFLEMVNSIDIVFRTYCVCQWWLVQMLTEEDAVCGESSNSVTNDCCQF